MDGLEKKWVDVACAALVEAGWLLPIEQQTGGRPSKAFKVNPRVHER